MEEDTTTHAEVAGESSSGIINKNKLHNLDSVFMKPNPNCLSSFYLTEWILPRNRRCRAVRSSRSCWFAARKRWQRLVDSELCAGSYLQLVDIGFSFYSIKSYPNQCINRNRQRTGKEQSRRCAKSKQRKPEKYRGNRWNKRQSAS
jgi:hypothetical protein